MKTPKTAAIERKSSESMTVLAYPQTTKQLSIVKISVNGRHPFENKKCFIEHDLCVMFYILNGKGKVYIETEVFEVGPEDIIEIRQNKKYYIEGNITYLAITAPAYYKEQNEIVDFHS